MLLKEYFKNKNPPSGARTTADFGTTVKPRFWNTFTLKILFKKRFFAADQNF